MLTDRWTDQRMDRPSYGDAFLTDASKNNKTQKDDHKSRTTNCWKGKIFQQACLLQLVVACCSLQQLAAEVKYIQQVLI